MEPILYTLKVPTPNIIAIIITFIISVFVPIMLLIIIRIKTKAKISSFFIGALTFFIFVVVFERMLHSVVLTGLGNISQLITNNIWLYALYGGLAAGIFEETGRFISIKFYMKNNLNRENALMYGAGHGGMESILIVGLTYVSNLVGVFLLNSGMAATLFPGEQGAHSLYGLEVLITTPTYHFYIAGIERLLAITLHMALSILIYKAATQKGKMGYYPLAIGLHFICNFIVVIVAHYFSLVMAEIACLVCVAVAVVIATRIWNESKTEVVEVNF